MDNIEWKEIEGTDCRYEISNNGLVWSNISSKILKTRKGTDGHIHIGLHVCPNQHKDYLISRLVALHFIPNDNPYLTEVNHIDGDNENNSVDNLFWMSHAEIMDDAW